MRLRREIARHHLLALGIHDAGIGRRSARGWQGKPRHRAPCFPQRRCLPPAPRDCSAGQIDRKFGAGGIADLCRQLPDRGQRISRTGRRGLDRLCFARRSTPSPSPLAHLRAGAGDGRFDEAADRNLSPPARQCRTISSGAQVVVQIIDGTADVLVCGQSVEQRLRICPASNTATTIVAATRHHRRGRSRRPSPPMLPSAMHLVASISNPITPMPASIRRARRRCPSGPSPITPTGSRAAIYCGSMPAALQASAQRTISLLMKSPNSAGVCGATMTPTSARRFLVSGRVRNFSLSS